MQCTSSSESKIKKKFQVKEINGVSVIIDIIWYKKRYNQKKSTFYIYIFKREQKQY